MKAPTMEQVIDQAAAAIAEALMAGNKLADQRDQARDEVARLELRVAELESELAHAIHAANQHPQ